jgi:anti-sigma factor ChrR (cupin superfamily)
MVPDDCLNPGSVQEWLINAKEIRMNTHTPGFDQEAQLAPLSSRYLDVDALPWVPSRFPGVDIKVLMTDPATGLHTSLTRFAPGASLPDHEHMGIEQSWVLEGRLVDDEGECKAGQFVWRPAGNRHTAHAPEGALVLGFFQRPNKFFDQDQ